MIINGQVCLSMRQTNRLETAGLGGFQSGAWLQGREVVSGGLSIRSGRDDGPLVVLKDGEPICQIGSRVVARIMGNTPQIGAQERSGELGNELFDRVAFAAESAGQIPVRRCFPPE
jgi:hypothetical protein